MPGHARSAARVDRRPINARLTGRLFLPSPVHVTRIRTIGAVAAVAAAPLALAYRFAVVYRDHAGHPQSRQLPTTPADLGLPFEEITIASDGLVLAGWFIPARDGARGPGVVVVHGWESTRSRTLPNARLLHALGFHVMTFDVRGHGASPSDGMPVSGREFGIDAAAAAAALAARPEVTSVGILGHSMGGVGALLAASTTPGIAAVVSISAPADPQLLVRETFRMASLPIPSPVAAPLAWLTARVYARPRGHAYDDVSATVAASRYRGPLLLVQGDQDGLLPLGHLRRLEEAALAARWPAGASAPGDAGPAPVEVVVIPGGRHSFLFEDPGYRRAVSTFLATHLGGPVTPSEAGEAAAVLPVERIPEPEDEFGAVASRPRGLRLAGELFGLRPRRELADEG